MEAKEKRDEELENLLVERLCRRNGWEHPEDCDNAVRDVKWFLSQPEIFGAGEQQGIEKVVKWVEEHTHPIDEEPAWRAKLAIYRNQWQAFLKGIDKEFAEEELKDLCHNASDDTIG